MMMSILKSVLSLRTLKQKRSILSKLTEEPVPFFLSKLMGDPKEAPKDSAPAPIDKEALQKEIVP